MVCLQTAVATVLSFASFVTDADGAREQARRLTHGLWRDWRGFRQQLLLLRLIRHNVVYP